MTCTGRIIHPAGLLVLMLGILLAGTASVNAQDPNDEGIVEQEGFFDRTLDTLSLQAWSVIEGTVDNFTAFLAVQEERPRWRFELPTDAGAPVLLQWRQGEHHPGVGVLTYHAGSVGTHRLINVYRAVVIDLETGEALDSGLAVHFEADDDSTAILEQPEWTWADVRLIVDTPGEGVTEIELPPYEDHEPRDYR